MLFKKKNNKSISHTEIGYFLQTSQSLAQHYPLAQHCSACPPWPCMAVLLRRLHIPCTHTVAASASLLIILMKEFLKSNGGWERQHTDIINLDCQKASVTVLFLSNLFLKPIKLGSKYFYMEDISYCYGPNPVWDWTGRINGQFPS